MYIGKHKNVYVTAVVVSPPPGYGVYFLVFSKSIRVPVDRAKPPFTTLEVGVSLALVTWVVLCIQDWEKNCCPIVSNAAIEGCKFVRDHRFVGSPCGVYRDTRTHTLA